MSPDKSTTIKPYFTWSYCGGDNAPAPGTCVVLGEKFY